MTRSGGALYRRSVYHRAVAPSTDELSGQTNGTRDAITSANLPKVSRMTSEVLTDEITGRHNRRYRIQMMNYGRDPESIAISVQLCCYFPDSTSPAALWACRLFGVVFLDLSYSGDSWQSAPIRDAPHSCVVPHRCEVTRCCGAI